MSVGQTFSIIEPDPVGKNAIGTIYSRFEEAGLQIVAARRLHLSKEQTEGFYAVHKEHPFFGDLVDYMTSGPALAQVLEGENAIATNREVMGVTDPKKVDAGTIRASDSSARARHFSRGEYSREAPACISSG